MNIMMYQIQNLEPEFFKQLSRIKNVNIFYAISEYDAYRIAYENKPHIMISGKQVTQYFLYQFHERNPFVIIYQKDGNPCFIKDLQLLMDESMSF
jgi:hypothetical protein